MGSVYGWRCEDCGAEESFYCGGGMLFFNEPAVVELSRDGKLGPTMKGLLGDGIPEGWVVFRENVFYSCPRCGGIINGGTFRISDGGPGWLVYHVEPEPCPSCGEELMFWDDKAPMSRRDIVARCESRVAEGCSECSGANVKYTRASWD